MNDCVYRPRGTWTMECARCGHVLDYEENPDLWRGYRFENHKARDKTVKCCKGNITNPLCQIDTKRQP